MKKVFFKKHRFFQTVLNLYRVSFIVTLLALLWLRDVRVIFVVTVLLWIVSYRDVVKLNKRVLKSIFLFNAGISLGYVALSFFKDVDVLSFLVYINLKVYLLTYFVFWFFKRVDMIEFFSFSKELSYLLSISLSQIVSYKKTYEDFRLAYKARVIKRLRDREKGFIGRVFDFFLQKALKDAKERSLAMKARGFF